MGFTSPQGGGERSHGHRIGIQMLSNLVQEMRALSLDMDGRVAARP
ncbi:hypothetical protein FHS83_002071 [Rhizomicrobium palustre]|uniref:Uncharacterized protein n=1 Tax=Rhizomicrobium palustre TaxID=189966 RepID=A0A846MZL6_9PROT|nr:hypothetical protein [Rhizomicrobium palustre]